MRYRFCNKKIKIQQTSNSESERAGAHFLASLLEHAINGKHEGEKNWQEQFDFRSKEIVLSSFAPWWSIFPHHHALLPLFLVDTQPHTLNLFHPSSFPLVLFRCLPMMMIWFLLCSHLFFLFLFPLFRLLPDVVWVRGQVASESSVEAPDHCEAADRIRQGVDADPARDDDGPLRERRHRVGRAHVVVLAVNDLALANGLRHVDGDIADGAAELRGGGSKAVECAARRGRGESTAQHFLYVSPDYLATGRFFLDNFSTTSK